MTQAYRSQAGRMGVQALDSPSIDAFSRWRVSNPVTIFDNQQQFGDNDLVWENAVTGAGSATQNLARASVILSNGGVTSGDYVYRQTRAHFRYQPGKSQMLLLTFVMGAAATNVRKRIGAFDAVNGFYLEQSDEYYLCKRTSTSGAPVEVKVAQSAWNLDQMNGRGPSGVKMDFTQAQILVIDFQWLGVGRVRIGFDVDGKLYYVHEFLHANVTSVVYMGSANLPVRAEVENTAAASGAATLEQICSSIVSEGGFETERGFPFSADSSTTLVAVAAKRPILTVRAKLTGPNGVINTGQILPQTFDVLAEDNSALVQIIRNGTLGGVAASWNNVDAARSLAEYDRASTTITGGVVVASFTVPAGGGGPFSASGTGQFSTLSKIPLVRTTLLGDQDRVSIVVTPTGAGTANCMAVMNWQELY